MLRMSSASVVAVLTAPLLTMMGTACATGGSSGARGGAPHAEEDQPAAGSEAGLGGARVGQGATSNGGRVTGDGASSHNGVTGGSPRTESDAAGGNEGTGGAGPSGRGGSASVGAGGSNSGAGSPSSCGTTCTTVASGTCALPAVRITEIDVGSTVQNNVDEAYLLPLSIAPMPGGGSRLAWMSGSTNYGSSTTSLVHVAELDCDDQLAGTPFTLPAHDFQDLAADANGGVIVLTRDAEGTGDQHCGDVNHLCALPSDRPGCYDMYMVRYDCSGKEQWATKLTSSNAANPPYSAAGAGGTDYNYSIWWYQHHGRIAYDGTNYAAYFCDAITVKNNACVDIHQGDRMEVVGPNGALIGGRGSFDLGCSHSGFTRILWDAAAGKFIMICKTDNNNRIAQPNPYRTLLPIVLDGSFVGDIVKSQGEGYWFTASNGGTVHLLHWSGNSQTDQDQDLANANYPHLVAYGETKMIAAWAATISGNMTAQVFDTAGGQVSGPFSIAVPGNPYQSFKSFPDGSAAYASPGTSGTKIRIARILPCGG